MSALPPKADISADELCCLLCAKKRTSRLWFDITKEAANSGDLYIFDTI
jgi:hypothetical protein